MGEIMNTREVAAYLKLKARKIYDLARSGRIPATRVTGKWLFSKRLVDAWIAEESMAGFRGRLPLRAPAVVAGSHDPLLEWAARESGSGLALLAEGSEEGLPRLAAGEAMLAGVHLLDRASGAYNVPAVKRVLPGLGVVALTWAWREQGLVLAPGNPARIEGIESLAGRRVRVVRRQPGAGSRVLLDHLLEDAAMAEDEVAFIDAPARSETDVALAVREGKADAGLAVATVARQHGLAFVPLWRERYDLVLRRRDYFEPPVQALFDFARSPAFAARAEALGGYDISALGRIVYNAP